MIIITGKQQRKNVDALIERNGELVIENESLQEEIKELKLQVESIKLQKDWYERMYKHCSEQCTALTSKCQSLVQEKDPSTVNGPPSLSGTAT